jgi:hypothetical protein
VPKHNWGLSLCGKILNSLMFQHTNYYRSCNILQLTLGSFMCASPPPLHPCLQSTLSTMRSTLPYMCSLNLPRHACKVTSIHFLTSPLLSYSTPQFPLLICISPTPLYHLCTISRDQIQKPTTYQTLTHQSHQLSLLPLLVP